MNIFRNLPKPKYVNEKFLWEFSSFTIVKEDMSKYQSQQHYNRLELISVEHSHLGLCWSYENVIIHFREGES